MNAEAQLWAKSVESHADYIRLFNPYAMLDPQPSAQIEHGFLLSRTAFWVGLRQGYFAFVRSALAATHHGASPGVAGLHHIDQTKAEADKTAINLAPSKQACLSDPKTVPYPQVRRCKKDQESLTRMTRPEEFYSFAHPRQPSPGSLPQTYGKCLSQFLSGHHVTTNSLHQPQPTAPYRYSQYN